MNKILGISNGNYIDMLLSKKMFSFTINKLSTTDNILNGKPYDVLYTGYLNKDISFGDIIYFEPKNVQYKKLANGTIDQLKVSLIDGDGDEILSNFNSKKRSHTQLDSRKQVIAFQDRVITINIKEAQHPLK